MKQVFINLPVSDLERSFQFYNSLGFSNNPDFSDDQGKCMVWSDSIFVMIMTKEKFSSFTTRAIADIKSTIPALYSLSVDSTEIMNSLVDKGLINGGIEPKPMSDYGFMQARQIEDPDGHTWEIFYMDMSKLTQS
ncbi:MAG: hypothetical protein U0V49_09100 [Saprospiraceae bacterium]